MNELVVVATGRRLALHTGLQDRRSRNVRLPHPAVSNSRGFRTRQTSGEGEGAQWGFKVNR